MEQSAEEEAKNGEESTSALVELNNEDKTIAYNESQADTSSAVTHQNVEEEGKKSESSLPAI